jgi:hypothetical protein
MFLNLLMMKTVLCGTTCILERHRASISDVVLHPTRMEAYTLAPQKPKNLYAYSVGFLNDTRVSDHRFQGPAPPIFLLYIMNNAIRLHSIKNIQLFLSSRVSSFKLNMYNILAFLSLGSKIQVSWDRMPYPLMVTDVLEKLAIASLAPRFKFCGIKHYRFPVIPNVNMSA